MSDWGALSDDDWWGPTEIWMWAGGRTEWWREERVLVLITLNIIITNIINGF